MKKRFRWPMVISLIIFFIAGFFLLARQGIERIPSMDEQLPPGSTAIQIRMTHPTNKSSWPMNYLIPIQIAAWGAEPVASLELYVNGFLYDTKTGLENIPYDVINTQWNWQPGDSGIYLLTARAVGAYGSYGISDPVMIESTTELSTGAPLEITENTTLEQIAKDVDVSLTDLQNANPHLPADQPVQVGEKLLIPNLPAPVNNNIIPAFDPQGQSVSYPDPNQPEEEQFINPPKWNMINDLQFLIKSKSIPEVQASDEEEPDNQGEIEENNGNTITDPSKLPEAVDIFGYLSNDCNVELYVHNYDNDGCFIYRSRDGGPFERIATLPTNYIHYSDENQYGLISYYAAPFNEYGETPGLAKPFLLNPMNCNNGNGFQMPKMKTIWLEDNGDLSMIADLDTAYLYIQINDNQAERAPKGNQMYLANSGVKFNINTYLESRDDLITMTDFIVHMEIWGWQAGELRFAGNLDHTVHRSVLLVCDTEGEGKCSPGSLGNWDTEMTILPHIYKPLNEQKYELRWLTNIYDYPKKICLRMGEEFIGPKLSDTNSTLPEVCFEPSASDPFKKNEGTYLLDFGEYLYPDRTPYFPDFDYKHPLGDPFNLAIRAMPYSKITGLTDVSNTVFMHHLSPYEQDTMPTLASDLSSIYDIKFLPETYSSPILFNEKKWGCIVVFSDVYYANSIGLNVVSHGYITDDDIGADAENCWNPVSSTCNQKNKPLQYAAGTEICPDPYSEPSSDGVFSDFKKLVSGIVSGVTGAWDSLVNTFEKVKTDLTEEIAAVIPYCEDTCKMGIKKGLEAGFTALTGLPPNLPTYEGLREDGIAYAVELTVEEIGPDCDDTCKAIIEKVIRETINLGESSQRLPGCVGSDEAHAHDKEELCFPSDPRIKWGPAAGAVYQRAMISLQVTRKPMTINLGGIQSGVASADDKLKYRVWVDANGFNDTRIGDWFPICGFIEGLDGSNELGHTEAGSVYHQKRQINDPLESPLYKPLDLHIPWLDYGESVTIPIAFVPEQFWRQNHLWDVQQREIYFNDFLQNCGDDWPYLFYGGTTQLNAVEQCINPDGDWVPCTDGGSDTWKFYNPQGP